jgi:uncharacterized membrane protein YcaP (DUF421 family)
MDNLLIKDRRQLFSRKIIALIWIVVGIFVLMTGKGPLSQKEWMRGIIFFIIGAIYFTPLVGSSVSKIEIGEGCLSILWLNWIRKVTIQESEIEGITIAQQGISIKRMGKKPLKIKFIGMDKDQIRQTQDFFTNYAREKSLIQD